MTRTRVEKAPRGAPLAERLELFLEYLAERGDAADAMRRAGLSLDAVSYRRRRDPEFAAGWELAVARAGKAREHLVFLDVYRKTGNQTEALRLSGLRRADVAARLRDDPDFVQAFEDARLEASDLLEAEARRRAVDGVEDLVVQGGRVVYQTGPDGRVLLDELGQPVPVVKRLYSDRLLETLLKANAPEKFRENLKVDHAVTGGVLLLSAKAPATEEEWEARMSRKRPRAIENDPG